MNAKQRRVAMRLWLHETGGIPRTFIGFTLWIIFCALFGMGVLLVLHYLWPQPLQ